MLNQKTLTTSGNGQVQSHALGVTVVIATHRPEYFERLLANYLKQEYPAKELVIVLNNNSFDLAYINERVKPYSDIKVLQPPGEVTLGYCYNCAWKVAKYDLIAKFDDDDLYSSKYLEDSIKLFACTNADIVGKICRYIYFPALSTLAIYCPGAENEFVSYVVGATLIIKKKVLESVPFPDITAGEDSEFQRNCLKAGFNIYSGNRNHYITVRQSTRQKHTFQFDDSDYLRLCQKTNTNVLGLITGI